MRNKAIVEVVLEVELTQPWDPLVALDKVKKRAKYDAAIMVQNIINKAQAQHIIRVASNEKVNLVLYEKE